MRWCAPGATLLLAFVVSVTGAAAAEEAVVARSGGVMLTGRQVREMVERADQRTREQLLADPALLSQFVRSRLARLAILNEAKAKKWDQSPEVARQIEQARTDVIVDTYIAAQAKPAAEYPSDAEVEAAYAANASRFMQPRQYRLAQIFLAVPVSAGAEADDRARRRLSELQQQLRSGKAEFAALARAHSEDKASAAKGGELDWAAEDRLLPQVREAVSGLETGGVSEPLRAADGWHLIRLLDTRPAEVAPLAQVRADLVAALRQQKANDGANAFVVEFLRRNPVQLDEIALSRLGRN